MILQYIKEHKTKSIYQQEAGVNRQTLRNFSRLIRNSTKMEKIQKD